MVEDYDEYIEIGCDSYNDTAKFSRLWHLRFRDSISNLPFAKVYKKSSLFSDKEFKQFKNANHKFSLFIYCSANLCEEDLDLQCYCKETDNGDFVFMYYKADNPDYLIKQLILYSLKNMNIDILNFHVSSAINRFALNKMNKQGLYHKINYLYLIY